MTLCHVQRLMSVATTCPAGYGPCTQPHRQWAGVEVTQATTSTHAKQHYSVQHQRINASTHQHQLTMAKEQYVVVLATLGTDKPSASWAKGQTTATGVTPSRPTHAKGWMLWTHGRTPAHGQQSSAAAKHSAVHAA